MYKKVKGAAGIMLLHSANPARETYTAFLKIIHKESGVVL